MLLGILRLRTHKRLSNIRVSNGHVNLVEAIEKGRKKAMVGSDVLTINVSAFPVCPFQPRQKKPLEATTR